LKQNKRKDASNNTYVLCELDAGIGSRTMEIMIKTNGKFECIQNENQICFQLSGEIDHHNAVAMRSDMDKILILNHPSELCLDLSGIDFMDSSGLGLIMGRYTIMKKLGGTTVIKNPSARVKRILKLSAIERIIKIEEDK